MDIFFHNKNIKYCWYKNLLCVYGADLLWCGPLSYSLWHQYLIPAMPIVYWLSFLIQGRTGYPFIDAIMIQLRNEGWIHHLARHAVACFLTRGDLWVSWEHGMKVRELLLEDLSVSCKTLVRYVALLTVSVWIIFLVLNIKAFVGNLLHWYFCKIGILQLLLTSICVLDVAWDISLPPSGCSNKI